MSLTFSADDEKDLMSEIFFMIGLVKPLLYLVNPVLRECIVGNKGVKGIKGSRGKTDSLQQVAKLGLRLHNLTFGSGSFASKIAIFYGS